MESISLDVEMDRLSFLVGMLALHSLVVFGLSWILGNAGGFRSDYFGELPVISCKLLPGRNQFLIRFGELIALDQAGKTFEVVCVEKHP